MRAFFQTRNIRNFLKEYLVQLLEPFVLNLIDYASLLICYKLFFSHNKYINSKVYHALKRPYMQDKLFKKFWI